MEQVYTRDLLIPPSACDFDGRLSYPGAFSVFMDLATEHAELLGVGLAAMRAKSRFWLTVKTRIVYYDRPSISEAVQLLTWPEKPGPLRFNRSYEMRRDGALLVAGRTEWAVLNTETGALARSTDVLPEGLEYVRGSALDSGYARVPERFEEIAPFCEYRVRATDIDVGGHMNNAAYPRALFSALSSGEIRAQKIRSVDLIFRAPCFEGDTLRFYRNARDGGTDYRMARGGETVLLARVE